MKPYLILFLLNFLIVLSSLFLLLKPNIVLAESATVAVAVNFYKPMEEIKKEFEKETGHTLKLSYGGTKNFYTQIKNAAPFDIFLAADNITTAKLEAEGEIIEGKRFVYAIGALALWSKEENFFTNLTVLEKQEFKFLAVADDKLAPYGLAAKEVLINLNLWDKFNKDQCLVIGNNIGQTKQFAESGNAEIAFVAFSQIYEEGKKIDGSFLLVDENLYSPLKQELVLLKKTKNNKAAEELFEYLKSEKAKGIIKKYGYKIN